MSSVWILQKFPQTWIPSSNQGNVIMKDLFNYVAVSKVVIFGASVYFFKGSPFKLAPFRP